jgi:hypothetical protein
MDKAKWHSFTQWNPIQLLKQGYHNFSGKKMELEKVILSKVTQTQKDRHSMYSKVGISHKVQDNHATKHRPIETK